MTEASRKQAESIVDVVRVTERDNAIRIIADALDSTFREGQDCERMYRFLEPIMVAAAK